jgi:hypothetical protein
MTKKLIDWATVPVGAAVVNLTDKKDIYTCQYRGLAVAHGAFLERLHYIHSLGTFCTSSGAAPYETLRIAPADQQPWLVYEEGVTVIPDWAECEYRGVYFSAFQQGYPRVVSTDIASLEYCGAYKLGNDRGLFKAGWTDNPNEVKE